MRHEPDSLRAPTLDSAGKRRWLYPDRRSGRLSRIRGKLAFLLLLVYIAVPFVTIEGLPLLRFDILQGALFVFGQQFNFAEAYYLVFVLLAGALALGFVTSMWGRVWCGYACPQTVFVEWVVRPIEEWIEGPALRRRKADAGPKNFWNWLRKAFKHLIFILIVWIISHAFIAYFLNPRVLFTWIAEAPTQHHLTFFIMLAIFVAIYFDLIWFREQFCSFLCPYARFQSVMISRATPTVAYDRQRGDPRGHQQQGDCIDCGLCVRVCPTGIDIRNGLQLECIQCGRCVDACHTIMTNLKRPTGLIRTASSMELEGRSHRAVRWRPAAYLLLLVANVVTIGAAVGAREDLDLTILRQPGTTYSMMGPQDFGNYFSLRVVNRAGSAKEFGLEANSGIRVICSICQQEIQAHEEMRGSLVLIVPLTFRQDSVRISADGRSFEIPLLRPRVER